MQVAVRTVLGATDFSPASEGAIRWAHAIAQRFQAELVLFHALSLDPTPLAGVAALAPDLASRLSAEARRAAEARMQDLQRRFPAARTVIEHTSAREGILRAAQAYRADLVCVGTHGRTGLPGLLYGSVAQHVVVHSPVPVLTVRPGDRPARVRCVLAPTDFSPASDLALPWAELLARTFEARLVLLHVLEFTYEALLELAEEGSLEPVGEVIARRLEDRARADLAARAERLAPCETLLRTGLGAGTCRLRIVEAIQEVEADLVVMGTHGRSGVDRLRFGSVAEYVVRTSPVPVLTVRQQA